MNTLRSIFIKQLAFVSNKASIRCDSRVIKHPVSLPGYRCFRFLISRCAQSWPDPFIWYLCSPSHIAWRDISDWWHDLNILAYYAYILIFLFIFSFFNIYFSTEHQLWTHNGKFCSEMATTYWSSLFKYVACQVSKFRLKRAFLNYFSSSTIVQTFVVVYAHFIKRYHQ